MSSPHFIHPVDGQVMVLAGPYEYRQPEIKNDHGPATWLMTCTIIAPGRVRPRMPLAPAPPLYDAWLHPHPEDPDDLRALLIASAASTPKSLRTRRAREPGPV